MNDKCDICVMFDCGTKCKCKCHHGAKPLIRQDNDSTPIEKQSMYHTYKDEKDEKQAMEGLSALFG